MENYFVQKVVAAFLTRARHLLEEHVITAVFHYGRAAFKVDFFQIKKS